MKFFPESLVPDPDKKINLNDKDLINKIIEKLLTKEKNLKMIKQDQFASKQGEIVTCKFLKNDKEINIGFQKVSFYDKKDFDYNIPLMNSFWDCIHDRKLESHVHEELPNMQYLPESEIDTKKLCGIKIIISTYKHTSFAVGSSDTIYNDPPQENKLYKCAYQNLPLYVDWIKKYLIVT